MGLEHGTGERGEERRVQGRGDGSPASLVVGWGPDMWSPLLLRQEVAQQAHAWGGEDLEHLHMHMAYVHVTCACDMCMHVYVWGGEDLEHLHMHMAYVHVTCACDTCMHVYVWGGEDLEHLHVHMRYVHAYAHGQRVHAHVHVHVCACMCMCGEARTWRTWTVCGSA